MEHLSFFEKDPNYQEIISKYKDYNKKFNQLVNKRLNNKLDLTNLVTSIKSDLSNMLHDYYSNKRDELEKEKARLQNEAMTIGYADRQAEAEEFKMRYKLADDHELQRIAEETQSNDLLELNLLRMELKDRNLKDHDKKVKNYIMMNELNKDPENEERIGDINNQLATINTIPNNGFYVGKDYKTVENIERELRNQLNGYEPRQATKEDLINSLK